MKSSHYALVFPVLLLIGTFNIAQSQQTPEKAAQGAAESWMRLMDSRKHGEAWEASSRRLKERVTGSKGGGSKGGGGSSGGRRR